MYDFHKIMKHVKSRSLHRKGHEISIAHILIFENFTDDTRYKISKFILYTVLDFGIMIQWGSMPFARET